MLALARRHPLLPIALVFVLALVGCGKDEPATLGKVLPADTLAWLHLDELPAMEAALESYGLMDVIVEELGKPETRAELQSELGLTLADDPRETIHALMQDLRRVDVSMHAPLHADGDDPVAVVHLECADEAAAVRVMDMVREHSDGEVAVGDLMALRISAEGELALVLGHTGAHVVMASEAERWGEVMGGLLDPPAAGLVDTDEYRRVAADDPGQISVYLTPGAQSELSGLGGLAPWISPVPMNELTEKYGSQYAFMTADYLMTRLVSRQALSPGSVLEPLMACASGESRLMGWLPAGTFFYEGWLVENGRQKLELIQKLLIDAMATAGQAAPGQLPPGSEDPILAIEGVLGFSLFDLADRVREVAVAGAESPGWLLMLRAHDEVQAQEIVDMFGRSPALAMIPEGEPVTVGETTLRSFSWPADPEGRLQLLGRHQDTMLMAFQVPDVAAVEAFLAQAGKGALVEAAPEHAERQLEVEACGWGYLDLASLMTAVGADMNEMLEDVPPALAQRLRTLRLAGSMTSQADGVVETVLEMGTP